MQTAVTDNDTQVMPEFPDESVEALGRIRDIEPEQALFEIGAWLGGIDSFISTGGRTFGERRSGERRADLINELRVVRLALQRCSHLLFLIRMTAAGDTEARTTLERHGLDSDRLRVVAAVLRKILIRCETLHRADSMTPGEWRIWCDTLRSDMGSEPGIAVLLALVDRTDKSTIPERLKPFTGHHVDSDIAAVSDTIARIGRILRVLGLVGSMLERDEPLKPAILVFAKVNTMTLDMIAYLNKRFERMPADGEITSSLDGAAYIAAMELKKAVQQELAGILSLRTATGIFARTETAYSLLNESFQQILTGLARHIDESADMFELFPNFSAKRINSGRLRSALFRIGELTRTAELDPGKANIASLHEALKNFSDNELVYLFFKDIETFERFVEEILVTKQKKDLVPILHRFAAYVETLFAQVNMRAVLADQPFAK